MRARLLILLVLALPGVAHAVDDEAKRHFEAGIALVQKHDFAGALVELEQSYAANPLPETLFDIALCQREIGRLLGARTNLRRYIDAVPPTDANRSKLDEAQKLLGQTEAQLATLTIDAPPAAEIRVDGRLPRRGVPPSIKVDAGTHHVVGTLAGRAPVTVDVTVGTGEVRGVTLVFPPPPAPPLPRMAPPSPPPGVVFTPRPRLRLVDTVQGRAAIGLGAGALALFGAGAVTGGVVLSDRGTYRASCDHVCDSALYGRAHTLAVTTDVLFGVGGAAAITSLVLFLVHPHGSR